MGQILVRNLDDAVIERLRSNAQVRGTSLEAEARRVLAEGSKLTREDFIARAAAIRARQKPHRSRAEDLIREDRER
jgi:plasmid stability protein